MCIVFNNCIIYLMGKAHFHELFALDPIVVLKNALNKSQESQPRKSDYIYENVCKHYRCIHRSFRIRYSLHLKM